MWTSHASRFFEIFDSGENEFDLHKNTQPHYLKDYSQLIMRLLKLKKTATEQLQELLQFSKGHHVSGRLKGSNKKGTKTSRARLLKSRVTLN